MMESNKSQRYSRQLILDEIGKEGQENLFKASVLVVGAGGLGSPVLMYLACAGVGKIGVVDFDTVSISNLNRQTLYRECDIGKKKVDVAKETLHKLNSDITIISYDKKIDANNIQEIIEDYNIIIDCLDNFSSRYLLSDACYFKKKTLIEGAVTSLYGTITTIVPDITPCYRCIHPFPPEDGQTPGGILGATPGIIGPMQALEAIKIIVGFGEPLYGKILYFDGTTLELQEIKYDKVNTCPLCGDGNINEVSMI